MPICRKCNSQFSNRVKIDGIFRNFQNRRYCLECSPFNNHNTRKLEECPDKERTCPRCNQLKTTDQFYQRRGVEGKSVYCKVCSNEHAVERQQQFKEECVQYKGGKCSICNYDAYIGTLEFHHLNPNDKDFSPAHAKLTTFNDRIKQELDKCVLLCANCHREEHAKIKLLI